MPSMSLIWLNVIVSLSSEAFGHRSFSGTSCLLERELLWPEEWVAQPQVQLGRRGGSRPTLLLTEGWRRPVIHRGRSLRSGHQVHLEARVTRGRVKRALPSVAPLWGCRQGQDAARSSPPAQSVRKRSRSDCPLPPLPSPSPHGHGRLPGAQHLGELGHSHSCRRQRLVSAARGHSG